MDGLAAALDGASGFAPVPFIRIEGGTDGEGRRQAAARFRADPAVRVALLSVTAAGVGLDFSCASAVVFAGGWWCRLWRVPKYVELSSSVSRSAVEPYPCCQTA